MIDKNVILAVIYVIGGNTIVLILGIVYASVTNKPVDAGISALAGSGLGYLGGILTNVSRSRSGDLQNVRVANTSEEPVPTEPQ